ncbi:MAG: hypothetical protein AB9917_13820 [Negativicutes bacterium]
MARTKRKCATCGKNLAGLNFHRVYSEELKRAVDICTNSPECMAPFKRVVKLKTLKEGA